MTVAIKGVGGREFNKDFFQWLFLTNIHSGFGSGRVWMGLDGSGWV